MQLSRSPEPASGLDLSFEHLEPRLAAFLARAWGRPVQLGGWRRFPAGFSWVTIGFTALVVGEAESRELILRIGDPRGLLAPYQAGPEAQLLMALAGTAALPVPKVHAYCDDVEIIGAPFLITGHVPGDTPMPWRTQDTPRDEAGIAWLALDFADALAALHRFPWRENAALRALWGQVDPGEVARSQARHWAARAVLDVQAPLVPQMHYALRWLEWHAPKAEHVTVVHGDYRVGNFLQQGGRITAVLDWELAHAGDPHEDLAWAGLRIFAAGTTRIGGLFERDAFHARYVQATGFRIDPGLIRYYEVLGMFKSAAMLAGAMRRIGSGQARDIRMASMGFQLASTLLEMNRLLTELSA